MQNKNSMQELITMEITMENDKQTLRKQRSLDMLNMGLEPIQDGSEPAGRKVFIP
ncbi:hypothetical protein HYU22_02235 [Candidatus Woesearchaeota archaeon]|nr:hypothetical protein [Candidatus Woesearchaeota archaeon]